MGEVDQKLAVYQAKDGSLELRKDAKHATIWASKKQIAQIFGVDRSVVSRHIKNIFGDKELDARMVCAEFAHTTKHGSLKGKKQTRSLEYYNLDIVLAVGYRTKSSVAIEFRKWATKVLKQHITKGYTINVKRIKHNQEAFLKAVEEIKLLAKDNKQLGAGDVLELIQFFSYTWFSLDKYDKNAFPKKGNKKSVKVTAEEFYEDLGQLKQALLDKKEATDIFAQERSGASLEGVFGNVFQSVFGKDAYETVEEKSAHLLYFIVKNHPFIDGNKRSGAFAFVWFLEKAGFAFHDKITPEALAALTILVAESDPKEKEKTIGLILLLLHFEK